MSNSDLSLAGSCTLDHDGCVVCSDAGIPVRVIELDGEDARCEDGKGNQALVAIDLVQPVRVGQILLTHGGVAIGRADDLKPGPNHSSGRPPDPSRRTDSEVRRESNESQVISQ
jgi:hydrogenase expression/formation protein HypC